MVKTREEMTREHQLQRGVVCVVCVCVCVCGFWLAAGSYISPWGIHSPDFAPIKRVWVTRTNMKTNGEGPRVQIPYFVTVWNTRARTQDIHQKFVSKTIKDP